MGATLSKLGYVLFLALFFASLVDVQSAGIERGKPAYFGVADDEDDGDSDSDEEEKPALGVSIAWR